MAVIAQKRTYLTKEEILKRVSEYDILRAFWPSHKKLKLNQSILSPFREEKDESFIVGTKFGVITYKDMGDFNYRGDIWNFVQQMEHLADLNSVLIAIDNKLQLGIGRGESPKKSPIITWEQPKIELIPPPFIQVQTRKFTLEELEWWNLYFQDISDLKKENIYAPKQIYRNRVKIPMSKTDLVFCYWYEDIKKWKIYRPLRSKKSKAVHERKHDTNCPIDYVEHLDKIKGCKYAFANKSKKDRMVLVKALETECIFTLQAEDPSCLNDETLKYVKEHSDIQICTADNDTKGKQFSWWLTNNHGYKHCNVPDPYREHGITDFADWAREEKTLNVVREHFKQKGYL